MLYISNYKEELKEYVLSNEKLFAKCANKVFLISGAAGLIGSYLIDLMLISNECLKTNIKIYAVDKNKELLTSRFLESFDNHLHRLCLNVNTDKLPDFQINYVIHAASNTSPLDYGSKPVDTILTNVLGTNNMIEYSLRNNAERFMFCASVELYGKNNGDVNEFTEDYSGYVNSNSLRAGYPSAKRVSEALCNAYMKEHESFDFVSVRIGRIYGPTIIPGDAKAPTQFINNAVNDEDIIMKSAGTQQYSYCYVGDCAMGILTILLKGTKGEAYNVADPNSNVSLRYFAEAAAKSAGREVKKGTFTEQELAGYSKIDKAIMNMDKLISLGWSAKFNVDEGVRRTVEYIKQINKL